MTYFARYRDGDHRGVWDRFTGHGNARSPSGCLGNARLVAHGTMEIVADNVERLTTRLAAHGYDFETYPDGTVLPFGFGPLIKPGAQTLADIRDSNGWPEQCSA